MPLTGFGINEIWAIFDATANEAGSVFVQNSQSTHTGNYYGNAYFANGNSPIEVEVPDPEAAQQTTTPAKSLSPAKIVAIASVSMILVAGLSLLIKVKR